jgi:hypothetical protein
VPCRERGDTIIVRVLTAFLSWESTARVDENYLESGAPRRRPIRRVARGSSGGEVDALTKDLEGVAAAYAQTLLHIGFEVNGLIEIVVFPRYRFSSDDRVQGHLGNLQFQPGTRWSEILTQVDRVFDDAERLFRRAVITRATETRAHGARYEAAYSNITDLFRESWHGFALRLRREGRVTREGVVFEGEPPEPVLVTVGRETYTLHVSTTGSILLATGDRRASLAL